MNESPLWNVFFYCVCVILALAAIRDYQEITALKQGIGELKTQILEMKNNR